MSVLDQCQFLFSMPKPTAAALAPFVHFISEETVFHLRLVVCADDSTRRN